MDRQKKQYTPTKVSKLTNITNTGHSSIKPNLDYGRSSLDYNRHQYSRSPNIDYSQPGSSQNLLKEYEVLKMQVRQTESQNRQLSNDIEKLRYEKNINQHKFYQRFSSQEESIANLQKEKNYQVQLIKLKQDQDVNKMRRQYEYRLDQLHRQLRNRDYTNRQINQKNSYIQLKINQLKKGIQILEHEHARFKDANVIVREQLSKEEFKRKRLNDITEELEKQKNQMESEIHVLLDIEAEKSRNLNALESQLRNSEATERTLHEKLGALTQNFANLEEHIAVMKDRLISTDYRNEQLTQQLQGAEIHLADKDAAVMQQKQLEGRLRKDLETEQAREVRREKQIDELIVENERLLKQVNLNRQRLHDLCISQGIQV